mmetsp:Transcript_85648/g.255272  ORF Transcript_85648/g.255272 Transcript_85648/m.255272 type:complete len:346 (-) Transcript_85648:153-1190(-)
MPVLDALRRQCVALLAVLPPPSRAWRPDQCRDPLFATHWSGKSDVQTLLPSPAVRANLGLCRGYNRRPSCCDQMLEAEQQKYFGFWRRRLQEKILRLAAHRTTVAEVAARLVTAPSAEREQLEEVLRRYGEVLSPGLQARCFSGLLTYAAGMICFGCEPAWSRYTLLWQGGGSWSPPVVARVNVAASVCREMWAACRPFGRSASALGAAIRDSAAARTSPLSAESLDMFSDQQELCEWTQEEIALHPFRLLGREDGDVPTGARAALPVARAGNGSVGTGTAGAGLGRLARERRLGAAEDLDVLEEGRRTGFDLAWRSPLGTASRAPPSAPGPASLAVAALLAVQR